MTEVKVISLGGSIIAPAGVDTIFLANFRKVILDYLNGKHNRKVILITGGGAPARSYQKAYREILENHQATAQDWIGIAATRLNGELVKAIFGDECIESVVTDPTVVSEFNGRVLIAAGWKPGFSTDNDAVILAEKLGADTVINLSNISYVYTADPKVDPEARAMRQMTWDDYKELAGEEWVPGKNLPFDPVATKRAAELKLLVITAAGGDIENLRDLLQGKSFKGTIIGAAESLPASAR